MKIIAILPEYLLYLPRLREWFGDAILDAVQFEDFRIGAYGDNFDVRKLLKDEAPDGLLMFGQVAKIMANEIGGFGLSKVFAPHPDDKNSDVPRLAFEALTQLRFLIETGRVPQDTMTIKQREPALPALALTTETTQTTKTNEQHPQRKPIPAPDYYPDCEAASETDPEATAHSWIDKSLPPEPQDGHCVTVDADGHTRSGPG